MRYYLDNLFYNADLCAITYGSSQSTVFVLDLRSREIVQSVPLQIVPSALASGSSLPPPYLLPGTRSLRAHEGEAAFPQFCWFILLQPELVSSCYYRLPNFSPVVVAWKGTLAWDEMAHSQPSLLKLLWEIQAFQGISEILRYVTTASFYSSAYY